MACLDAHLYEIEYIYATSFFVNWAFLIARGTRLKHERSEGFKVSRAIRKAQFTQTSCIQNFIV
jgi:hypothetical protein